MFIYATLISPIFAPQSRKIWACRTASSAVLLQGFVIEVVRQSGVRSRQAAATAPRWLQKAPPFVAEGGGAFSYLLLLKFYGLRNSHGRHFVTNYAVLIGKRFGIIAAGKNCHIGLVFIISDSQVYGSSAVVGASKDPAQ